MDPNSRFPTAKFAGEPWQHPATVLAPSAGSRETVVDATCKHGASEAQHPGATAPFFAAVMATVQGNEQATGMQRIGNRIGS